MDLHDGGVDHGVLHVWIVRHGVEKLLEHVSFHPVPEADVDRVPFAKRRRQIPPGTARARDPQHRLHEQPVIRPAPSRVRRLSQTVRLHFRPLGISQNKAFHPELESYQARAVNPESQQALAESGQAPPDTHRLHRLGHVMHAQYAGAVGDCVQAGGDGSGNAALRVGHAG